MNSFHEGNQQRSYHQRLETFFKRHFCEEICDALRIAEPCVIVGPTFDHAFKFVVLTNDVLYVLANPPKSENDVEMSIELQHIHDANQVHDIPDFLSGDLKNNAQHISLSCTRPKQPTPTSSRASVRQSRRSPKVTRRDIDANQKQSSKALQPIIKTTWSNSDYSSDSPNSPKNRHKDGSNRSTKSSIRFNFDDVETDDNSRLQQSHPTITNSLPRASNVAASIPITFSSSDNDLKSSDSKSSDVKYSRSQQYSRPLPPPLQGTETLNAATVSCFGNPKRSGRQRRVQSNQRFATSVNQLKKGSIVKSSSDSYLSRSSNGEVLENSRNDPKTTTRTPTSKLTLSSSSSTLNRSFSERFGSLFGKSSDRTLPKDSSPSIAESQIENDSFSQNEADESKPTDLQEEFNLDIYLLNADSKFLPLFKATITNSRMRITEEIETGKDKTGIIFSSRVLEEFYQLKTDLLKCNNIEQAFILTKELSTGAKGSIHLKNLFWQTSELIQYYVNNLSGYLMEHDRIILHGDRADELDFMLVISELISTVLFNTEICPSRNKILFGQRGALVTKLVKLLLVKPDLPVQRDVEALSPAAALLLAGVDKREAESEQEKELAHLLGEWCDARSCLLYELLRATEQSKWTYRDGRGISLRSLIDLMENHEDFEQHLNEIVDGLMRRLLRGRAVVRYSVVVLLFKQFSLLRLVFENSPSLLGYVADHYYEEFRYYIGSPNAISRLPECPLSSSLLQVINEVTGMVINKS